MIKTMYSADTADVDELFRANGFTLAPMAYAERDPYDGTLTLSDPEEAESESDTVLVLWHDAADVAVLDGDGNVVAEEEHARLADALEAYERLTLEHGTSATAITM